MSKRKMKVVQAHMPNSRKKAIFEVDPDTGMITKITIKKGEKSLFSGTSEQLAAELRTLGLDSLVVEDVG